MLKTDQKIRTLFLKRNEDVSGVSGLGIVAVGVEFSNGQIVIQWNGNHPSIEIHPNLESLLFIHGHGGKTEVIFDT